ncbi:VOC family protein [Spirosoma fluviale]|uniref:Glyoxalase superfamily enzyme, possibly 3-demethylubiquinone-9 3-methyltransferase n=1 Tax=Spirosoma fluviale TaxID=1597977 RepID=A0A286G853_9BACT|nr:VOC family protein [Spirosoma fluviale]SOD91705.1 Glyoxalase superfamily enzyme, possibly 3-demethylubiquinone-9 3-methyltransferase [Spirosoma fluviale]
MQKITTFLTFNDQAEEAAVLYTSIFKNSKVTRIRRLPSDTVMSVSFELDGQEFIAMNGGPSFTFSSGTSLFVHCDTQEEVDMYWEKLCEGGEPGQCGWLKDKFGVSWQIIPASLGRLLGDKDPEKSKRTMQAMLNMTKIDTKVLEEA